MSLFSAREWWSVRGSANEEFDSGCLCVGDVTNEKKYTNKIVVGNLQGMLRVYSPNTQEYNIDHLLLEQQLSYPILQVEAGCFCSSLGEKTCIAILHPRKLVVYSLNPKGSFEDQKMEETAATKSNDKLSATYYELVKLYEHVLGIKGLHFTSRGMTCGPFGGVTGKDYICVQSMDGQLAFFEQEVHAFTRYLQSCLLPGPICYVPPTDSFVTCNSRMEIESYTYHVLASAGSVTETVTMKQANLSGILSSNERVSGGRKLLKTNWKLNIGEYANFISVAHFLPTIQPVIIILGERTLFCVDVEGVLMMQVRLPYTAACMVSFKVGISAVKTNPVIRSDDTPFINNSLDNLVILTNEGRMMVYSCRPDSNATNKESSLDQKSSGNGIVSNPSGNYSKSKGTSVVCRLIWASKLAVTTHYAVAVRVASFGGCRGLICVLDESGTLCLSYLGTTPPSKSSGFLGDSKDLNYDEMDIEHRKLLEKIRKSQSNIGRINKPSSSLVLKAQVPSLVSVADTSVIDCGLVNTDDITVAGQRLTESRTTGDRIVEVIVRLYVTQTDTDTLYNINLAIFAPVCVLLPSKSIQISSIDGSSKEPLLIPLRFQVCKEFLVTQLNVNIVAAYTTSDSQEPRTSKCSFRLPFCLVCRVVPPIKNTAFKFTIKVNQETPPLGDMFADMLQQPEIDKKIRQKCVQNSANVITFLYRNDIDCSILVSKTKEQGTRRYRIQSSQLDALIVVAEELIRRIKSSYDVGKSFDIGEKKHEDPISDLKISYEDPLPLADFFSKIDNHFNCRKILKEQLRLLESTFHHEFQIYIYFS